jgi:perosamine synthetase
MTFRIPLAQPEVTDTDRSAVMEVLHTPFLSSGPKVGEFERAISGYTGAAHAVAVNSGTSALQLAIRALGIPRGAEVILPSFTFSAVLNVILLEGLRPRFVDIDPASYNCTPEAVKAAIAPDTRLIIAVHTFGFPVDVLSIAKAAQAAASKNKVRIPVVEDACESLGAEVHGSKAGTFGDVGLFAFYPNKQITTGEGGMLVTSDEQIGRKAAQLRNQGRDPDLVWNSHAEVGYSYRISDINCALGISQLSRIEGVLERRQMLAEIYNRELARIPQIVRPPRTSSVGRISWFVYPVQLSEEFSAADRDLVCDLMARKGVATGKYFSPLHRQPVLGSSDEIQKLATKEGPALINTEFVADRVVALPFFNELTEAEIQEVCRGLEESLREVGRNT